MFKLATNWLMLVPVAANYTISVPEGGVQDSNVPPTKFDPAPQSITMLFRRQVETLTGQNVLSLFSKKSFHSFNVSGCSAALELYYEEVGTMDLYDKVAV